jgi:hypothetical protein
MGIIYALGPFILAALLVAIFGVLIFGVVAMGSKRFTPHFRNKLMRTRVALQALAVLVLMLLFASTLLGPT